MVSFEVALRLREAGLRWEPRSGDKFVLQGPEMIDDVFVLSDMVADLHHFSDGPVIGFNGTTEWALDSVDKDQVLWLPSEEQLRERLGAEFVRLERDAGRFVVSLRGDRQVVGEAADEAYALALLELIEPSAGG